MFLYDDTNNNLYNLDHLIQMYIDKHDYAFADDDSDEWTQDLYDVFCVFSDSARTITDGSIEKSQSFNHTYDFDINSTKVNHITAVREKLSREKAETMIKVIAYALGDKKKLLVLSEIGF